MTRRPAARPTPWETRRTTTYGGNPEASSAHVRNLTTGARTSSGLDVHEARQFQRLVLTKIGIRLHNSVTELIMDYVRDRLPLLEMVRRVTVLFEGDRDLIVGFNRFLPPTAQIPVPEQNLRRRVTVSAFRRDSEQ